MATYVVVVTVVEATVERAEAVETGMETTEDNGGGVVENEEDEDEEILLLVTDRTLVLLVLLLFVLLLLAETLVFVVVGVDSCRGELLALEERVVVAAVVVEVAIPTAVGLASLPAISRDIDTEGSVSDCSTCSANWKRLYFIV